METFTFIPYIGRDPALTWQRELLDAKAKSHAAVTHHSRRRRRDIEAHGAVARTRDNQNHKSRRLPPTSDWERQSFVPEVQILSVDQTSASVTRQTWPRGVDWFFGSLGSTCKVTNFEYAALDHYRGASSQFSYFSAMMMFFKDTVHRALDDKLLLHSLITYTAFLMARGHSSLLEVGYSYDTAALRHLRLRLKENKTPANSLVTHTAVIHLCAAGIQSGNTNAAATHLKFLASHPLNLGLEESYYVVLLGIMLNYDLPNALQINKSQKAAGTSGSMMDADTGLVAACLVCFTLTRLYPSQSSLPATSQRSLLNRAMETPGSGFGEALQAGFLLPELASLTEQFIDICQVADQYTCLDALPLIFPAADYTALVQNLCFEYYSIQTATMARASSEQTYLDMSQKRFSLALVLSFEVQLLSLPVCFLRQSLPSLARRLRACAESIAPNILKVRDRPDRKSLRQKLYLWMMLNGMLAAGSLQEEDSRWFEGQASRMVASMGIIDEHHMRKALSIFTTCGSAASQKFSELARKAVRSPLKICDIQA